MGYRRTVQTGLPAGEYCNIIDGCETMVEVADDGSAEIVVNNQEQIVALCVDCLGETPTPVPTTTTTTTIISTTTTTTTVTTTSTTTATTTTTTTTVTTTSTTGCSKKKDTK